MRDELGIDQASLARPLQAAWISAASFASFAIVPIVALLVAPVALRIPMGGTTSVDITKPGIDKAYGIGKLRDTLGMTIQEMIFIGDALFPGGNDYPRSMFELLPRCRLTFVKSRGTIGRSRFGVTMSNAPLTYYLRQAGFLSNRCWFAFAIYLLSNPYCTKAQAPAEELRTAEAVRGLTSNQAPQQMRVRLRGAVTFFDEKPYSRFIQDATAGIYLQASTNMPTLVPGQLVEIEGVSNPGEYAAVVLVKLTRYRRVKFTWEIQANVYEKT